MKATLIFLFLFSVFACSNAPNTTFYKVVSISDGDTFTLLDADNKQIKIRLYGIDCPEKSQDFGAVAKQKLSDLVFNQRVQVTKKDIDRYGRTVALVYIVNGICVNEEMLKAGLAWHYKEYDQNPYWDVLENSARQKGLGLWKQPNPTPPWAWRKQKRTEQANK